MARDFDKLNTLRETKSMPYDEYFGEMALTRIQKEKRIRLAEDLEDPLLFLFQLIKTYKKYYGDIDPYIEMMANQFETRYKAQIGKHLQIDDKMSTYIALLSLFLVNATTRHIADNYYTSNDRVRYISENETNTLMNYSEYMQAVKDGKTKKEWVDMKDNRERDTHLEVGGTIIPIDDVFIVGDSLMFFPKDNSLGASLSEIINCRCSIKYF